DRGWAAGPAAWPWGPPTCTQTKHPTAPAAPESATRLYLGFEEVWLSTNGGTSFGATPVTAGKTHVDHHAITFSPQSHWGAAPTRVYVGHDGGFAASPDGGTTWNNLNEGVATLLVRLAALDIGRRSLVNSQYSYAGPHANGTDVRTPG